MINFSLLGKVVGNIRTWIRREKPIENSKHTQTENKTTSYLWLVVAFCSQNQDVVLAVFCDDAICREHDEQLLKDEKEKRKQLINSLAVVIGTTVCT